MTRVDNAIIMAAGTSSRFAPLSYEKPKALIEVRGEVLIERQIRQLQESGIKEIVVVVGYKKEAFEYLKDKFGVIIVYNNDYLTRNNNASIKVSEKYLKNTYICSSDNYFLNSPFSIEEDDNSYYSALYASGKTNEWCMKTDESDTITEVSVGGENSWYMLGHVFWNKEFSNRFIHILNEEYDRPETANKLWEDIYISHLQELPMKIKRFSSDYIYEFDTLDELRSFDTSYKKDTRSLILKGISQRLACSEEEIIDIKAYKDKDLSAAGFTFLLKGKKYRYSYETKEMESLA